MVSSRRPNDEAPVGEPISVHNSYTKQQLLRATGIKHDAFRALVNKGLKARLVGRQVHVLGEDYLEFIRSQPTAGAADVSDT